MRTSVVNFLFIALILFGVSKNSYADPICQSYHGEHINNCISQSLRIKVCGSDCRKQFETLKSQAEKENATGLTLFSLAAMYQHGWGVKKDLYSALKWFDKTLEKNQESSDDGMERETQEMRSYIIDSQGNTYEELMEYTPAFNLYQQAAMMGNVFAQLDLARLYMLGRGTLRDNVQAYAWSSVAAAQGTGVPRFQQQVETSLDEQVIILEKENSLSEAKQLAKKYYDLYVLHIQKNISMTP